MSTALLKTLLHQFFFSRMTPLCISLPNVLFTCSGCFLKIFLRYATGQRFGIFSSILQKLPFWQYLNGRVSILLLIFHNTDLSENNMHKYLCFIFHHCLSWNTPIFHLHQKVTTKTNCRRSFSNSLPRHSLRTIYKTNISPNFDYGSTTYNHCSDKDKHVLDKCNSPQLKSY